MTRPDLHGAGLRLRPGGVADDAALSALLRLPDVRRFLCDDRTVSDATVAAILAESDADDALGLGLWVIETDEAPFAGIVQLKRIDAGLTAGTQAAGLWEPVVAVEPSLWRRGLGVRALEIVMIHARDGAGLRALGAMADEPNIASRRMLARCGFAEVGRAAGPAHPLILFRADLRA